MSDVNELIGRNKRRYSRGSEYISIFFLILANAKLFQTFFDQIGIGIGGGILLLGVTYGFGCWLIGYIDEFHGVWKSENDHSWKVVPIYMKLFANVEEIKKVVVKEEKKE
jgi:hypothetical protein